MNADKKMAAMPRSALYIISIAAHTLNDQSMVVHHTACLVEAANRDEAAGKGQRIAEKYYPRSRGFSGISVIAIGYHVIGPNDAIKPASPRP
jgi:hypothetical protein